MSQQTHNILHQKGLGYAVVTDDPETSEASPSHGSSPDRDACPLRSAAAQDLRRSTHSGAQAHGIASLCVVLDLVPEGKRTGPATYWFSVSAG